MGHSSIRSWLHISKPLHNAAIARGLRSAPRGVTGILKLRQALNWKNILAALTWHNDRPSQSE